ncbi:unnamed protein product [Meloidogyne enterolobii]|uniref:Uncharacterized protein n=1 Tax=Meloidogyne enterolobii TaxID=390850 RepID=A0ACB0YPJ4_MELEN
MASSLRLTGTALRELRIHLCQKSPESNGVRQFIENDYVDLKKGNRLFPILIRECSGIKPKIWARYEYGIEKSISVENESREKVFEIIKNLAERRMVYYFTSNVVDPPAVLYMGDDKEENELLIKYGWPEDVWFHVDKLSSAHVYLRLQTGQQISDISENLIEDCCQLVKANSIEGCKLSETDVVYTMWGNLKKTGDMVTGQVGFHKNKDVKKVRVQKQREIINRLNKTKTHATGVDFRQLREQRDMEERQKVVRKIFFKFLWGEC